MLEFFAGSTDQSIDLMIKDATSLDGDGLTGLLYNTTDLVASYRIGTGGSRVAIPLVELATPALDDAHVDGGFIEVDDTHMAGVYRLDLPDAVVATLGFVTLYLYGAADMVPVVERLKIVGFNPYTQGENGVAVKDHNSLVRSVVRGHTTV